MLAAGAEAGMTIGGAIGRGAAGSGASTMAAGLDVGPPNELEISAAIWRSISSSAPDDALAASSVILGTPRDALDQLYHLKHLAEVLPQ